MSSSFDLHPKPPQRPLFWNELVYDLQDRLADDPTPIYIVGGAVRDAYLHRPLHDLDLATPDHAVQLARRIANLMEGDVFVLDSERDVARVIVDVPASEDGSGKPDKFVIDVAAFRGTTLAEDLRDRDFTFNAMAVDFKDDLNLLIDPLAGEQDIALKRIRQCQPDALTDDPIRMLRAVRLSAQFGYSMETETLASIRIHAAQLTQTSSERIRDEFFKLLTAPKPTQPLRIAARLSLLQTFMPQVEALMVAKADDLPFASRWDHTLAVVEKLHTLAASISMQRTHSSPAGFEIGMVVMQFDRYRPQLTQYLQKTWADDRPTVALLLLAALLRGFDAVAPEGQKVGAEGYAERLRLSNGERQLLTLCVHQRQPILLDGPLNRLAMHRFWFQFGEHGIALLLLTLAEILGARAHYLEQNEWLKVIDSANGLLDAYFHHYEEIVSPLPLLDGAQLKLALKLRSGPIIGQLLKHIREGQVTGAITSVEQALEQSREYLQQQDAGEPDHTA